MIECLSQLHMTRVVVGVVLAGWVVMTGPPPFLDPVGSLVSTLLVVGWWVGHTFSKFVYFECCSVVMMVYCIRFLEC